MSVPSNPDTRDLWTPGGVDKLAPSIGGYNLETGGTIVIHTFRFHSAKYGKTRVVKIPGDATMGRAQIEDMAAQALEQCMTEWEEEAQRKAGKHAPSHQERLEVAAVLREFRSHAAKRKESTNGQLYYPVTKVG